jgi:hypothetical protein
MTGAIMRNRMRCRGHAIDSLTRSIQLRGDVGCAFAQRQASARNCSVVCDSVLTGRSFAMAPCTGARPCPSARLGTSATQAAGTRPSNAWHVATELVPSLPPGESALSVLPARAYQCHSSATPGDKLREPKRYGMELPVQGGSPFLGSRSLKRKDGGNSMMGKDRPTGEEFQARTGIEPV